MIHSLFIDNYKTLVNFKLELSSISVLVGTNGSGKTSVFEVLQKLCSFISERRSVDEVFPAATLTRWQRVNVQTYEIVMKEDSGLFTYHLEIEHGDRDKRRVSSEYVKLNDKYLFRSENGSARLYNDRFDEGPELLWDWTHSGVSVVYERNDNKLLTEFKKAMARVIVCKMNDTNDMGRAVEEAYVPDHGFTNVAAVYMFISQRYPDSVEKLRRSLKEVNHNFVNVYIENAGKEKEMVFEYKNSDVVYSLKFDELSDGEKSIFRIYVLINCFMEKGYSVFIDEPDAHLSIKEIQPWCMEVEDTDDGHSRQCVIISHNPEVIDYFVQTDGIWFSRLGYGATRVIETPVVEYEKGKMMTYSDLIKEGGYDGTE